MMGSRYIITGVQLGMLVGIEDEERRKELMELIIETQGVLE